MIFFKDRSLGCGYLPIFWCTFTCFTFALCYTIAVKLDHIYPLVPAISDTGAQVPEANIFSELFNISSLLLAVNMFLRFLQFKIVSKPYISSDALLDRFNKLAWCFGMVAVLGGTIIANFPSQEESNMVYFHDTGAVMLFGFGAVYCWLQTILTYKMSLLGVNPVPLFAARLILTCIITVFGSIFFIAEVAAYDMFRQQTEHTVAHWQPDDPGYSIHVLSNIGEWLSAFCFGLFSVTFFDEFQCVTLTLDCKAKAGALSASESTDYLNVERGDNDDEDED